MIIRNGSVDPFPSLKYDYSGHNAPRSSSEHAFLSIIAQQQRTYSIDKLFRANKSSSPPQRRDENLLKYLRNNANHSDWFDRLHLDSLLLDSGGRGWGWGWGRGRELLSSSGPSLGEGGQEKEEDGEDGEENRRMSGELELDFLLGFADAQSVKT